MCRRRTWRVTVTAQGVVGAPTTLSVAEGASNTYEVSLATQPTADVTVTPGSSDTAVATVSAALTFSADDWATAQTITVSGVAAGDATISHTVSGGDYGGVVAPDVTVTVAARAVTVEPMVLSVAVDGSNTYEVSLATQPTADVTVTPASSATTTATVSDALTFTTETWAEPQTVTVTGVAAATRRCPTACPAATTGPTVWRRRTWRSPSRSAPWPSSRRR